MLSDESDDSIEAIALMVFKGLLPGTGGDEMHDLEHVWMRAPNKQRNFRVADMGIDQFYFGREPLNNKANSVRRFRIPRSIFNCIKWVLHGRGFFQMSRDATVKRGVLPRMRIIAVLRVLSQTKTFDKVYKMYSSLESSVRDSSFLDM